KIDDAIVLPSDVSSHARTVAADAAKVLPYFDPLPTLAAAWPIPGDSFYRAAGARFAGREMRARGPA
ncbi:hypothetical protein, partial [Shinella sp.]|uniref:hypothetical protein n=1 Tax=Shinella sp. TaxID=1870904 RepID=UPI003F72A3B0